MQHLGAGAVHHGTSASASWGTRGQGGASPGSAGDCGSPEVGCKGHDRMWDGMGGVRVSQSWHAWHGEEQERPGLVGAGANAGLSFLVPSQNCCSVGRGRDQTGLCCRKKWCVGEGTLFLLEGSLWGGFCRASSMGASLRAGGCRQASLQEHPPGLGCRQPPHLPP